MVLRILPKVALPIKDYNLPKKLNEPKMNSDKKSIKKLHIKYISKKKDKDS